MDIHYNLNVLYYTRYIFGGFTEKAWSSFGSYMPDKNAFIFSLVNHEDKEFILKCQNVKYAIYCAPDHGPSFGNWDICIANDSNLNKWSRSRIESFQNPDLEFKQFSNLAGEQYFQTVEIEVFERILN